jgi:Fur family ferric uptake transcriptional regulator
VLCFSVIISIKIYLRDFTNFGQEKAVSIYHLQIKLLSMSEELKMVLKNSRLIITKSRLLKLKNFLQKKGPLDFHYFLHCYRNKVERIALFRTLRLFIKKKIIYSVYAGGASKYFLCQIERTKSENIHSTFVCNRCGKTIRLENITLPSLRILKGFKEENLELIIHGDCKGCKN